MLVKRPSWVRHTAFLQHAVSVITESRKPIAAPLVAIVAPARCASRAAACASLASACALLRHSSMRHLASTRTFGVAIAATLITATFTPVDAQTTSDAALADLRRLVDDQRRLLEEQTRRLDAQARELEALRARLDDASAVALAARTQLAALTGSCRARGPAHRTGVPGRQPGSAAHARTAGPGRVRRRLSGIDPHSRRRRRAQDRRAGAHDAGAHARGARHR